MRYLGLDVGAKNIGVSCGEAIAKELATISAVPKQNFYDQPQPAIAKIAQLMQNEAADAIVIGLPIGEQGQPTVESAKVKKFGDNLAATLNIAVHYTDETLTSFMAEDLLAGQGLSPVEIKKRVHQTAAALILQQYLENLPKLVF